MKIGKISLPFLGFLQATGLVIYILLVSQIMENANRILGPSVSFLGPIAFILLFVISALTSGFIVLARAGYLFWEKRYKESFILIGWTLGWAVIYLILVFLVLFLTR